MITIILARNMTGNGVERYISGLLMEIEKLGKEREYILITDSKRLREKRKRIKVFYLPFSERIFFDFCFSFFLLLFYPRATLLYTKNIIPLPHLLLPQRKIVIIHDLGYFSPVAEGKAYPFLDRIYIRVFLPITLFFANTVVAVSKTTKNTLLEYRRSVEKKIVVAPPGIEVKRPGKKERKKVLKRFSIAKPYFFYPGSLSPRKNIPRLIKGFFQAQTGDYYLYITSGRGWGGEKEEIQRLIHMQGGSRVRLLPFLNEIELFSIMKEARAITYPSLLEGVGLPILEAQALGVPVLTSAIPVLQETTREGAVFIDPENILSIKKGLETLAYDEKKREEIIQKGAENILHYDYANTLRLISDTEDRNK